MSRGNWAAHAGIKVAYVFVTGEWGYAEIKVA